MSHTNHSQMKHLALVGGRTIAYADTGDLNSNTLVVFFHGMFGIGSVPSVLSPVLIEKHVHYLAPTLPGWGESSSVPTSSSFPSCLIEDTTALITHLHPDTTNLKLYICGGSYGTVPAQILYGASYDVFPLGRHIAGLLLMATFSPFRLDPNYRRSLTWTNYLSVGPPAYNVPFNIIPRLLNLFFKSKTSTPDAAENFIRVALFDKMDEDEQKLLAEWCDRNQTTKDAMIKEWSERTFKSVESTWDGYLAIPKTLHEDWGFNLPLDDEHSKRHVLVVASTKDDLGKGMAEFIVENYKNARLKMVEGGHIAGIFHIDSIWAEFII